MIPIGASVYLDANAFIYWVEGDAPLAGAMRSVFAAIAAAGAGIVTSELTVAECLYKPHRDGNMAVAASYEDFFRSGEDVALLPLNGEVALAAARQGGAWGLKLADAIHFVSALEHGCGVFVTADRRFRSAPGMQVLLIAPPSA
jgi:predicted nucleic acid-binding protein